MHRRYRYLGFTFQSPLSIAMRMAHPSADVLLIEDGVALISVILKMTILPDSIR